MTQPAGWYDDPTDGEHYRYWDGAAWTPHSSPKYTDMAGQQPDQAVQQAVQHDQQAPGYGQTPPQAGPPTPWTQPQWSGGADQTMPLDEGLSGWWRRVGAKVLDTLILFVVASPLLGYLGYRYYDANRDFFREQFGPDAQMSSSFTVAPNGQGWYLLATLAFLALSVTYEATFLRRSSRTPGKRAAGIAVRPMDSTDAAGPGGRSGSQLSWDTITRRVGFVAALSLIGVIPVIGVLASIASLLDVLWPLWDQRNQALHDKVARTVVVRR